MASCKQRLAQGAGRRSKLVWIIRHRSQNPMIMFVSKSYKSPNLKRARCHARTRPFSRAHVGRSGEIGRDVGPHPKKPRWGSRVGACLVHLRTKSDFANIKSAFQSLRPPKVSRRRVDFWGRGVDFGNTVEPNSCTSVSATCTQHGAQHDANSV